MFHAFHLAILICECAHSTLSVFISIFTNTFIFVEETNINHVSVIIAVIINVAVSAVHLCVPLSLSLSLSLSPSLSQSVQVRPSWSTPMTVHAEPRSALRFMPGRRQFFFVTVASVPSIRQVLIGECWISVNQRVCLYYKVGFMGSKVTWLQAASKPFHCAFYTDIISQQRWIETDMDDMKVALLIM